MGWGGGWRSRGDGREEGKGEDGMVAAKEEEKKKKGVGGVWLTGLMNGNGSWKICWKAACLRGRLPD